jgi:hypothetical protein
VKTFQFGTSGKGFCGAQASVEFHLTKGLSSTGYQGDYQKKLDVAKTFPIILFDTRKEIRRGWLVSASSVMLHLVHVFLHKKRVRRNEICATAASDGALAAEDGMRSKRRLVMSQQTAHPMAEPIEKYILEDLVSRFWAELCSRKEKEAGNTNEIANAMILNSSVLHGWEFMDIVNSELDVRRKELKCSQAWTTLTKDVLVLFGQDFGNVIRPGRDVHVCEAWYPIPCGQDYLTASLPCLQQLSEKRGTGRSCKYLRLTNDECWVPEAGLFEDCGDCTCCAQDPQKECPKRPQKLSNRKPSEVRNVEIPSGGAITFGRRSTQFQDLQNFIVGEPVRANSSCLNLPAAISRCFPSGIQSIRTSQKVKRPSADPLEAPACVIEMTRVPTSRNQVTSQDQQPSEVHNASPSATSLVRGIARPAQAISRDIPSTSKSAVRTPSSGGSGLPNGTGSPSKRGPPARTTADENGLANESRITLGDSPSHKEQSPKNTRTISRRQVASTNSAACATQGIDNWPR